MKKIKYFLSIDFIILLIINLFVINIYFLIFQIVAYLVVFSLIIRNTDNAFIAAVIFGYIIHKIWLPVLYSLLENKSKNFIVQKFIYNLKNNWKWKFSALLLSALFPFATNIKDDGAPYLFIQLFAISGFSSYFVLFIWWGIRKKLK
ncbi:hypothetical protein IJ541_06280 [bacterium]|nr:hypothetical protein [bacterium]